METLQIVGSDKLEAVIKESGLQVNDGAEIKAVYLPYLEQLGEIASQAVKINADNPTKLDEEIASKLRKQAVKVRTASESTKDERKRLYLIRGNLESASYNVIKNTALLMEESFRSIEEYSERQEAQKKLALKNERTSLLQPYCENPELYPLGDLSEGAFNDLLNGFRLQKEAREKAESDRLEALRLEEENRIKNEKINILTNVRALYLSVNFQYEFTGETPLGELSDNDYDKVVFQAKNIFEAKQKEQERIKKENEKLKKDAEAKEKKLVEERKRQDAILATETARRKKIEDELKEKQAKEDKARQEALKQEKEKLAAEKKAAKQPDKIKLTKWVDSMDIPPAPLGMSSESDAIGVEIATKFNSFLKWALTEIETL